jgi:chromate transporter
MLNTLLSLFWLFLKINLLSTSGIASVGLLHEQAVGTLLTEQQFVQAVSFSSVLPGSDALQLAMFTGFRAAGLPGAGAALLGSILPPTVLILGVVAVLHRLRREAWVSRFVEGLAPAVAVLMFYVAAKLVLGGGDDSWIGPYWPRRREPGRLCRRATARADERRPSGCCSSMTDTRSQAFRGPRAFLPGSCLGQTVLAVPAHQSPDVIWARVGGSAVQRRGGADHE